MLHGVSLVRTDISKERSASIILRVQEYVTAVWNLQHSYTSSITGTHFQFYYSSTISGTWNSVDEIIIGKREWVVPCQSEWERI
jgi:hypothetical protein